MHDVHQLGPLLDRCRAGDAAALEDLLARLRPYVRLLVRPQLASHLGRKLDESDLIQESLLRVYTGFGRFAGQSVPELLGWVGKIVGNVVATSARYHGAGKRDAQRETAAVDLQADDEPPGQAILRDEEAAALAAALERLPARQRQVLEARFFDRLSFADISRQTGTSEGALRVLCLRAIEGLRREMGVAS